MESLESKTEERYIGVNCSHCNSEVKIPKEIKQWLDKIKSAELLERNKLLSKMFDSTK